MIAAPELNDFIRTARQIGATDTEIIEEILHEPSTIPQPGVFNQPSPPPRPALLSLKNISKTFHPSAVTATTALHNVTFDIYQGEFLAITGQSGSGKSTLLNLLGLIDDPTEGEIVFTGASLQHYNEEQKVAFRLHTVGMVFQFFNLIENYTAAENIMFQLNLQGYGHRHAFQKTRDMLSFLGLENKMNSYPKELSGGEQQRVAIGRALAKDSTLILADEPAAHLDANNSQALINLLRQVNREFQRTIVLVSHEPAQAQQADRILTLRDGKILNLRTTRLAQQLKNTEPSVTIS